MSDEFGNNWPESASLAQTGQSWPNLRSRCRGLVGVGGCTTLGCRGRSLLVAMGRTSSTHESARAHTAGVRGRLAARRLRSSARRCAAFCIGMQVASVSTGDTASSGTGRDVGTKPYTSTRMWRPAQDLEMWVRLAQSLGALVFRTTHIVELSQGRRKMEAHRAGKSMRSSMEERT